VTLEVRQLVLKSTVHAGDAQSQAHDAVGRLGNLGGRSDDCDCDSSDNQDQLKEDILAQCRAWMHDQLMQLRER